MPRLCLIVLLAASLSGCPEPPAPSSAPEPDAPPATDTTGDIATDEAPDPGHSLDAGPADSDTSPADGDAAAADGDAATTDGDAATADGGSPDGNGPDAVVDVPPVGTGPLPYAGYIQVDPNTSFADNPPKEPPVSRPRLFGSNAEWAAHIATWIDMPCVDGSKGRGKVPDVKDYWDISTVGGATCDSPLPGKPAAIADHPLAEKYLSTSPDHRVLVRRSEGLRLMHLLRYLDVCHASDGDCPYTEAERDTLQSAFVSQEMAYFLEKYATSEAAKAQPGNTHLDGSNNGSWCACHGGMIGVDAKTADPIMYWSLFYDLFRDQLTEPERDAITAELDTRIDNWLLSVEGDVWNYANGNNWTPAITWGLAAWAVVFYHEDARVPEILASIDSALAKHTDFYFDDGSYKEGLFYGFVSFDGLIRTNDIVMASFGKPLHQVHWSSIETMALWATEQMSPDGRWVDFGDTYAYEGWNSMAVLDAALVSESIGVTATGTAEFSPCWLADFFTNNGTSMQKGFENPWFLSPSLARDWAALVEQCQPPQSPPTTMASVYPQVGLGVLRQTTDTPNTFADPSVPLLAQAHQTYLAVNGIYSGYPHTEMDFGTLLWSAYGNRLLFDWDYGGLFSETKFFGGDVEQQRSQPERHDPSINLASLPSGHNTLVLPDAHLDGHPETDLSQIYKFMGSVGEAMGLGLPVIAVAGDDVYGASHSLGHLDHFRRWLVALDDGHFLVVDAVDAKGTTPVNAAEYWHTGYHIANTGSSADACDEDTWKTPRDAACEAAYLARDCKKGSSYVDVEVTSATTVQLSPKCRSLSYDNSSVVATMVAASTHPGAFTEDEDFFYSIKGVRRQRFAYSATAPVDQDVRVFALVAAPVAEDLPTATVVHTPCGADHCFDVAIGSTTRQVRVTWDANGPTLTSIDVL